MPIQFACTTCGKPIEIDDEFAGQAVTCPYCRNVMQAPARSANSEAPNAIHESPGPSGASSAVPHLFTGPQPTNWFASASLICAILMLLSLCLGMAGAAKVMKQIAPDMKLQPNQMEQVANQAAKEPMVMTSSALMLLASVLGVIFAILGLTRRTGRRWQAIVGLVLCGLMLACGCLNIVVNASRMAGAGGS